MGLVRFFYTVPRSVKVTHPDLVCLCGYKGLRFSQTWRYGKSLPSYFYF